MEGAEEPGIRAARNAVLKQLLEGWSDIRRPLLAPLRTPDWAWTWRLISASHFDGSRALLIRWPQRASKQEIEDSARSALAELYALEPAEVCPICRSLMTSEAMVLAVRLDDNCSVCFVVVECTSGHSWQRWADRADPWEPSDFRV